MSQRMHFTQQDMFGNVFYLTVDRGLLMLRSKDGVGWTLSSRFGDAVMLEIDVERIYATSDNYQSSVNRVQALLNESGKSGRTRWELV